MVSDFLERASRLQAEAREVMKTIRLMESLHPFGEIVFTGVIFWM